MQPKAACELSSVSATRYFVPPGGTLRLYVRRDARRYVRCHFAAICCLPECGFSNGYMELIAVPYLTR